MTTMSCNHVHVKDNSLLYMYRKVLLAVAEEMTLQTKSIAGQTARFETMAKITLQFSWAQKSASIP